MFRLLVGVRTIAALCVIVPLLLQPSVATLALAAAALIVIAGSFVRWTLLNLMEDAAPVAPQVGLRVAVATTLVPGVEPLPMLERTLAAMVALHYPHDTWLLDEGDDAEAIELCRRLGVHHFSRRDQRRFNTEHGRFQHATKHGNYNAWLAEVGYGRYDVLAAIDPDHVPRRSFLIDTLGQLSDPRIAYVQSPQDYYNQRASFIARGCSEEGRDFYWIAQSAYHHFRTPSVIGAHGVHRVEALRSVDGLAPHVADDLLLTLRYQEAGWRGAYVRKTLARGLAPVDWRTYVRQQRRWARSLFDVKLRLYPRMAHHLPIRTRIVGLLQGLSYLQDAAAALLCAAALGAILLWGLPAPESSVALIAAPLAGALVLNVTGLYPHLHHGPYRNLSPYWRAGFLRSVKWPYTLLALWDVVAGRNRGYSLTPKHDRPATVDWSLYWPHLALCAFVAALWALAIARGNASGVLPNALAAAAVLPSVLLILTSMLTPPPAFDPSLADLANDVPGP